MKKFILLSLFGLLVMGLTTAAYAQSVQQVIVPPSSIEKPEDVGKRFHTNVQWLANPPVSPKELPPASGYAYHTPASLACIYKLVPSADIVPGCNPNVTTVNPTGGGGAIAIVDAYDAPNALSDLQTFSSQFGLPVPSSSTFQVVYASGTQPAYDAGWEVEESLDVQWAHAMAPNAKIYLVEAASASGSDLFTAVSVASKLADVADVSMSWGGSEFSGEDSYDSYFQTPYVVYFAATGDNPGTSYPSTSPYVVAVGGTTLRTNDETGKLYEEWAWTRSGGGLSQYETWPAYQYGLKSKVGRPRGVPDVSVLADAYTGAWVYVTNQGGWNVIGGTSLATPIMAGMVNSANWLMYYGSLELLAWLYSPLSLPYFQEITNGICGPYMSSSAGPAWNICTGLGTPRRHLPCCIGIPRSCCLYTGSCTNCKGPWE